MQSSQNSSAPHDRSRQRGGQILATTLGETGGDTVSMTWLGETTPEAGQSGLNGYLIGTGLFGVALVLLVGLQIRAQRFNPWLYWATIVASTTCGTTLADFADRSLRIGYPGGSLLLLACVLFSLFAWYRTLGTVDINTIATSKAEAFYWATITFSQTLGTALGDWIADAGLGYGGGALVFSVGLAVLAALYFTTNVSHVVLFWAAFILTRPLGATVGDFPREADRQGRPGAQPSGCVACPCGSDHRADSAPSAAAGRPSNFANGGCVIARTRPVFRHALWCAAPRCRGAALRRLLGREDEIEHLAGPGEPPRRW